MDVEAWIIAQLEPTGDAPSEVTFDGRRGVVVRAEVVQPSR
jgi:hypothetical protein